MGRVYARNSAEPCSSQVENVAPSKRTGTKLTIRGLHEPQYWRGPTARHDHLVESMSTLISPFQRFTNFRIVLEVDGNSLELHEIGDTDSERSYHKVCTFDWTEKGLHCEAQLKLGLFRGSTEGTNTSGLSSATKDLHWQSFSSRRQRSGETVVIPGKRPVVSPSHGDHDFQTTFSRMMQRTRVLLLERSIHLNSTHRMQPICFQLQVNTKNISKDSQAFPRLS